MAERSPVSAVNIEGSWGTGVYLLRGRNVEMCVYIGMGGDVTSLVKMLEKKYLY